MKSTGIVRRIDELGRVVIPKELRRTMHMREGEELEVFTDGDSRLVFEKYSPIKGLSQVAHHYVGAINRNYGVSIAVMDRDRIIAYSGRTKSISVGNSVTKFGERLIEGRKAVMLGGIDWQSVCGESPSEVCSAMFAPILKNGDVLGGVCIFSESVLSESMLRLAVTLADLISIQA